MNVNQWGEVDQWEVSVAPPIDTTPPVITLLGSPSVTVTERDSYVDAGATASDNVDGDITANIVTVNPVDTNTVETYTVRYNVSDSAGNAAEEVTRTVVVEALVVPIYSITVPNRFATIGASFSFDTSRYFIGTETPFTYTLNGTLPNGLSFDTATGIISGVTTIEEVVSISVTATDAANDTATSNTFNITSQESVVIPTENRGTYTDIHAFLLTQGYEGSVNDVLNKWLEDEGLSGTFNDKMIAYLRNQGYEGSLPDMRYSWIEV